MGEKTATSHGKTYEVHQGILSYIDLISPTYDVAVDVNAASRQAEQRPGSAGGANGETKMTGYDCCFSCFNFPRLARRCQSNDLSVQIAMLSRLNSLIAF